MDTEQLINTLAKATAPVRVYRPLKQLGRWFMLVFAYLCSVILMLGVRPDMSMKVEEMIYLLEIGLCFLIGISAAFTASVAAVPDMQQRAWMCCLPFIPMIALAILLLTHNDMQMPAMEAAMQITMPRVHVVLKLALLAVIPGLLIFMMMRKAAPTHYYWAGSMAVLAVSSFAYVALRLVETNDNVADVMLWCYVPMLAFGLLGMWLGKYALKW